MIRSVLEGTFVFNVFRGGLEVVGKFFLVLPAQAGSFVPSGLHGGIHSCFWVFHRLTNPPAVLQWSLACPSVPCDDSGSDVLG